MFPAKFIYFIFYLKLLLFLYFFCECNTQSVNPCDIHFDLESDLSQEDCEAGYVFKKNGNNIHTCFGECVPFDLAEPCSQLNPCPPGYVCSSSLNCELDQSSCLKHHIQPTNPWKDAWKPNCLPDGSWAAKQCKGEASNGRCFCYDSLGNRIFGQEFMDHSANMTCACSRKKTELRNDPSRFYSTLYCDSMGNYEPLQCDDGHCWCAESKTGKITSKVVPFPMMTILPCYSKEQVGTNYTRQCESDEFAQKNILHEFNLHGTQHINFPHVICDDDGNYGYYQIVGGQAYCKWKDNSNILGYTAGVDENIQNLNCYCARDTKIYESVGSVQYLLCLSNGNYKPDQYHTINEKWYCVDKDGFKSSDFFDDKPDCTPYI